MSTATTSRRTWLARLSASLVPICSARATAAVATAPEPDDWVPINWVTNEFYFSCGDRWLIAAGGGMPAAAVVAQGARWFDRPEIRSDDDEAPGLGGRDVAIWRNKRLIGYVRRRADGQLEAVAFAD